MEYAGIIFVSFIFFFGVGGCVDHVEQRQEVPQTDSAHQRSVIDKNSLLQVIERTAVLLSHPQHDSSLFVKLFDSLGNLYFVKTQQLLSDSKTGKSLEVYIDLHNDKDRRSKVDLIFPPEMTSGLSFKDLQHRFGEYIRPDNFPKSKEPPEEYFELFKNDQGRNPVRLRIIRRHAQELPDDKILRVDIVNYH